MAKAPPERRYRRRTVRVRVALRPGPDAAQAAPRARAEEAPEDWERAYATTLGAGGLFVECERPRPPGSLLRLRFRLELRGPAHELAGRVVWTQAPDPPGAPRAPGHAPRVPGMGIEFTEPEARAALARALARLDAGGPEAGSSARS